MKSVMDEAAKRRFRERVGYWAKRLEVAAHSVVVRPMRTKWASCSTTGRLTFNSELLTLEDDLWDLSLIHI